MFRCGFCDAGGWRGEGTGWQGPKVHMRVGCMLAGGGRDKVTSGPGLCVGRVRHWQMLKCKKQEDRAWEHVCWPVELGVEVASVCIR